MKKDEMISIKTEKEIEIMKKGGRILAEVMRETIKKVKPGKTTADLDQFAEALIRKKGGRSSFKTVPGYSWTTCICVNDAVVHGVPNKYCLKEGDILSIDAGVFYQGFHTDMARTIKVKNEKRKIKNGEKIDKFLKTGELALRRATRQAKPGNHIGHISRAIQETVEKRGYSVVKTLVGHGVGKKLHEDPQIPGFLNKDISETPFLKEGMTLAIEVIYNQGSDQTYIKKEDGWTILTKDGRLSALFENTIVITRNKPLVLTGLA